MMHFPFFEAVMMVCFGCAWPASLLKSWRARTNKGKSVAFLIIVITGYVAGLLHKIFERDQLDWVVALYVLNALMVSADLVLYFRNRRLDAASSDAPCHAMSASALSRGKSM